MELPSYCLQHYSTPSHPNLLFRPSFISSTRPHTTRVFAAARRRRGEEESDEYNGGRLVDMNMIVLRKRIHEIKMVERNYEPPSDWSDWEKQYFSTYDSLICDFMGLLQSELMDTRPFVALGMIVFVAFSVPFSSVTLFSHFMDMAKLLSDTIHFL
ncbi:hypothetical protein M5689_014602 [Euphorbia peplus]|nr:hypothetical protein M5689_014602 [Euphorbia peplus]